MLNSKQKIILYVKYLDASLQSPVDSEKIELTQRQKNEVILFYSQTKINDMRSTHTGLLKLYEPAIPSSP